MGTVISALSLLLVQPAHSDTRLTLIVKNIPSGWGTANGDSVALVGTMNGWSPLHTATIADNTLRFEFTSISTAELGADWSDKPAGANVGFRFVDPANVANTLIKTDFRTNDGNFRLALQAGADNTVEIDASPIRTLVDQASCVRVNGLREREYVRIDRNRFAFPGGLWKALVMSYDDEHDQDRGLIPIFNQYGIKGTFHLTSSWLDTSTFVSSEDVRTIYAPHEVSVHTVSHPDLTYINDETIRWEVGHSRWVLSGLAGYDTCSMSYPMGGYDTRVLGQLPGQGITCARTVENTFSLDYLPVNPLKWHPTCHHANAGGFADAFIARAQEQMALLFIWGHSYELDYGYVDNSWAYMSALCQKLGHRGDTWYAGMEQVRAYLAAIQALDYPARNVIHNPSPVITIWAKPENALIKIAPGKTITYPAGQVVAAPEFPAVNDTLAIRYDPGTNALGTAANVLIHIGRNGWQDTQDLPLARQADGTFTGSVSVPAGTVSWEWAFFDGNNIWDDNGGNDWSLAVRSRTPETPAAMDLVRHTCGIQAPPAGQNNPGENVDIITNGCGLGTTGQGGFGDFGTVYANCDATHLYLSGPGMNVGGNNNAAILFISINTLPNPVSNLWEFTGTPYGLDQLHNVMFSPAVNLAILLGDEYGDGNFMHFNLESGADIGQGVFYLDGAAKRFIPVPCVRLAQFDGAGQTPVASTDDDGNRQTDRWEVAIPWESLNARMGAGSVRALYLSGLIASDGVSQNDRYLSANFLGAGATGIKDANGNYGFNFVALAGQRVGLVDMDSDLDGMPDVFEKTHHFNAGDAADGIADADGDGLNNVGEYIAGTNPGDGASVFQCLENPAPDFPMIGKTLRWEGVAGRRYFVEASTNQLASWFTVATNLPPAGVWTDPVQRAEQPLYYRLGAVLP